MITQIANALEIQYLLSMLPTSTAAKFEDRCSIDLDAGLLTVTASSAIDAYRLQNGTLEQVRLAFSAKRNQHSINAIEYRWGEESNQKWRHPVICR